MPIYEYECKTCAHRFEVMQKFSDMPISECEICKGKVRKVISSPAIVFKGSGWYVTDYSSKYKDKGNDRSGDGKVKSEKKESSDIKKAKDGAKQSSNESAVSSSKT